MKIRPVEIFDYDEIQLIPRKCVVAGRGECNTSIRLGNLTFDLPVVPANMTTILDENLCVWLAENNYFYIMHRFNIDAVKFTKKMHQLGLFSSISLGVKPADRLLVDTFTSENIAPDYITIDIAHGHAESVKEMIAYIKDRLPKTFVIAGNIGTPEAVIDLESWGADATKVGIGPGKVCITKLKTGFGTAGWQLSAIHSCAKVATKPIIADGGIRHHGDIAKSIAFGASFCMIGSIFAAHKESPGEIIIKDGLEYKVYYGSASQFNKSEYKNIEGKKIELPCKGSIKDTLIEIKQNLQSSISYAGGKRLNDLQQCEYVIIRNPISI